MDRWVLDRIYPAHLCVSKTEDCFLKRSVLSGNAEIHWEAKIRREFQGIRFISQEELVGELGIVKLVLYAVSDMQYAIGFVGASLFQ